MAHTGKESTKEQIVKLLCLKWEAIRRNPEYKADYESTQLTKHTSLPGLNNKNPKYFYTSETRERNKRSRQEKKLCEKWGIQKLIDPEITYKAQFYKDGKFFYDPKAFVLLQNHMCMEVIRCPELTSDFHSELLIDTLLLNEDTKNLWAISLNTHLKETMQKFKQPLTRKSVSMFININRPKTEIMAAFENIIDFYHAVKCQAGQMKPPALRKRIRPDFFDDALKTYDLVQQKRLGDAQIPWSHIARQRYPNQKGDSQTAIQIVRNEYKRAFDLISGGFREI